MAPLGRDQGHGMTREKSTLSSQCGTAQPYRAASQTPKATNKTAPQRLAPQNSSLPESIPFQGALAQLGQWGIVSRDFYAFFDQTTALIRQTLAIDYCGIWELLPNRSALLLCAGDGWPDSLISQYTIDATTRSFAGYTIRCNDGRPVKDYEAVIAEDLRLVQKFRASPLLHNLGVVSAVNIPIAGLYNPFGVLGIYSLIPRQFSTAEIEFLTVASHILAATIDRQEYEGRLQLLERAIDASSNGILMTDAITSSNPIVYVNHGFERITGFSKFDALGHNCRFLQKDESDPEQRQQIQQIRAAIAKGTECEVILKNYRKDGSLFWNHLHISPVYNQHNCLVNFIGIQTDVTQQKLAAEQLKESEERLGRIIHTITDGLLIVDEKDGLIRFVNPAAQKMFQRDDQQLIGQPFGIPLVANQVTEITLTPGNGEMVTAEMRVAGIRWQDQPGFLVSLRDITEQYQARQALAESEEKYRHIVELTSEGIWILDSDQETVFANPQLAAMLGYSVEEILRRNISSFILSIHHIPEIDQTRKAPLKAFPSCVLPNQNQIYDVQL
ncbi:MAG: hypothetical protein RLZZ490_1387 [Cyanobacteriota bacterium]